MKIFELQFCFEQEAIKELIENDEDVFKSHFNNETRFQEMWYQETHTTFFFEMMIIFRS